ncbi:MAG TPA: phosphoribosylpyrophosphate synthetase [Methylomirabilota bacterium]|jgi:hypothetical protein
MGEQPDPLSDVARAVDELTRRGFPENLRVADGSLEVVRTGERLRPEDLVIRAYYRFEGVSDPDDLAIVYGIESKGGARGVLVDAFGVYADPALGAVLQDVPIRQTAPA